MAGSACSALNDLGHAGVERLKLVASNVANDT